MLIFTKYLYQKKQNIKVTYKILLKQRLIDKRVFFPPVHYSVIEINYAGRMDGHWTCYSKAYQILIIIRWF